MKKRNLILFKLQNKDLVLFFRESQKVDQKKEVFKIK
jgi:hypothetical protein